jgi:hypothetical protein
MKMLLVTVLLGFCAYLNWSTIQSVVTGGPEPLREGAYVVVYGRDSCGITKRTRAGLSRAGVPYEYKSVDNPGVGDELHPRMRAAGLDTSSYGLPVVDVSSTIRVRPQVDTVADDYRQSLLDSLRASR